MPVKKSRPMYSPTTPSITSWTPEKSSIVTTIDAQPIGVSGRNHRSARTKQPSSMPPALSAKPVNVLNRNGSTEKFTNMLSQSAMSLRRV